MTARSSLTRVASIELDTEGRVVVWSAEAERLLGWTADEAMGVASHVFIPARNRARHEKECRRVLAGPYDRAGAREISVLHRNGSERRVNAVITRVRRHDSDRLLNVISAVDIPADDAL